jgi:hypothetical protein
MLIVSGGQRQRIAARRRDEGERDAGVAAGRLDQLLARAEHAVALGIPDQRRAEAALHRVGGVAPLDLAEDRRRCTIVYTVESHQGRAADKLFCGARRRDRLAIQGDCCTEFSDEVVMQTSAMLTALAGGVLIGAAASGLLLCLGRIAGISGVLTGLLVRRSGDTGWRLAFVLGLLSGGAVLVWRDPGAFGASPRSLPLLAVAGLLVGVGTRIGNGCTSGHGVCGLARRSVRSLAATLTFMASGAVTVYVTNHLWGAF